MLGSFYKTFKERQEDKAVEPLTWENIPEVKIDKNNLNIVTDFKATDDGIDIRTNESYYSHVLYDDLVERDKDYTDQKPLTYDNIFEEMIKRLSVKPVLKHQCTNCLAVLELDINKRIFHCPYCNAVYAISEG